MIPDTVDVLVAGAGPAGLGAALAAARAGARTLLVEHLFHVGGIHTGAFVSGWCDAPGGPIFEELTARLQTLGAVSHSYNPDRDLWRGGRLTFQPEMFKAAAMEMLLEAGVTVLLGALAETACVEDGAVHGVWLATKGQRRLVRAAVTIDCTADADLAASAGVAFDQGDPRDGHIQMVNFWWRLGGVSEADRQAPVLANDEKVAAFRRAVDSGDIRPPRGIVKPPPDAFPWNGRQFGFTYWEIAGVDPTDPAEVSRCLAECHRAALDVIRFARKRLPGFENAVIERLPALLGTRESRRIQGRYSVTEQDMLAGRKFPDGVARAGFWSDYHDAPPHHTTPYNLDYRRKHAPPPGDWYEIPYRALLPRKVDGLLVAGRAISCERPVQAAMRIMRTCFYTGHAAGLAAALAAAARISPAAFDPAPVRQALIEQYMPVQ
jgi:glycine/D-amino acid oxidase-like deaminating enzyme